MVPRKLWVFTALLGVLLGSPLLGSVPPSLQATSLLQEGYGLVVSPPGINYGEVTVGKSKKAVLTITNQSKTKAFSVQQVKLQKGKQFDFCGLSISAFTLLPGQSKQIPVCFAPKAEGLHQDAVVIQAVDQEGNPTQLVVPLQGEGVTGGPGSGPGEPDIQVSPTIIDFGVVPVGQRARRELRISNVGQADLRVQSFTIQGGLASPFDFCGQSLTGFTLPASRSVQIPVCFRPQKEGLVEDHVIIRSNDPDESTVAVRLRGGQMTGSGSLQAELSVDKGCGAQYRIGEPLIISFRVSRDAFVTLSVMKPNGSEQVLMNRSIPGGVAHRLQGTVGEPEGTRILILEARVGEELAEAECQFTAVQDGPNIVARIRTDRGCLEEGQTPIYFVGDPITVSFRVDGVSQAVVRILDVLPDGRTRVVLQQVVPGNRELSLSGTIEPPEGRETLVLQVLSAQGAVSAEDRCSFIVAVQDQPQPGPPQSFACLQALLVGVEEGVTPAEQARFNNTVRRAREGLTRNWGFRPWEITELLNNNATKKDILEEIEALLDFDLPECAIKIHLFGHGVRDPMGAAPGNPSGPDIGGADDPDEGFVAWSTDGDPNAVVAADVLWDFELVRALSTFQRAWVIAQLDSCWGGGMFEEWTQHVTRGAGALRPMPGNLFIAWSSSEQSRGCFIRAGPHEQQGWAWTQAVLVEGFSDPNVDTIREIHQYPRRRGLDTAPLRPGFRDGSNLGDIRLPLRR